MRIAIAGKGGSGKTMIAGTLARLLAGEGHEVLAVDADTNPNLGISLGLGVDATANLEGAREALAANGGALPESMEDIATQFGVAAGDGVCLVQVAKFDYLNPT